MLIWVELHDINTLDILPEDDIKISGSISMFVWQICSNSYYLILEIANSKRQLDKLNNDCY